MAENPRIEELRRRVRADPASIAFAALAEEFRRVGRYEDAIETCRTGLQRHPAYLSARVTLGRALIETGDFEGAREELETVLRSAPENIAAIRGLAQINDQLGQSTEMHPDLAALANQPIRLVPPPAPETPASSDDTLALPDLPPIKPAPTISLGAFDLPLASPPPAPDEEPFDIFSAALKRTKTAPKSPAKTVHFEPVVREAVQTPSEPPPVAFEPATIAFEAPVLPQPDPHVAETRLRLERFLGAIRNARHA